MTSKHTPGPWTVELGHIQTSSGIPYWQVTDGHDAICCNQFCMASDVEANARLIAAAPDLLDALQHLSSVYEQIWVKMSDGEMAIVKGAWELAEKAIAKAEGRP